MSIKQKRLIYGIIFDLLGMVSIVFPPFDLMWAPFSAYLMLRLYKGRASKVAALISFIEETLPMTDLVPSFTLMWLYTYIVSGKK